MIRCARVVLLAATVPLGLSLGGCTLLTDALCPPRGAAYQQVSLVTPEATFATFQGALRAGNEVVEYRCLSRELLDRYGLDLQKYVLGRRRFLRKNRREAEAFRKARIVDVIPERSDEPSTRGREIARVLLASGDLAGEFVLINDPYYEIAVGAHLEEPELLSESIPDLRGRLSLEGAVLTIRIPLEEGVDPASVAGVVLRNEWKVLEFRGIWELPWAPEESKEGERVPRS